MIANILPAISVAIFNEQGDILLQKRTDKHVWGVISGHVEYGENVTQAALREIKEETGCEALIRRLIGVYSDPESQTYEDSDGRKIHYITTYFEATFVEQFHPVSNEETEALRFFSIHSLPSNLLKMSPYWLEDALNKTRTFIR